VDRADQFDDITHVEWHRNTREYRSLFVYKRERERERIARETDRDRDRERERKGERICVCVYTLEHILVHTYV